MQTQNSSQKFSASEISPLKNLDEWEEAVLERYPDPKSLSTI